MNIGVCRIKLRLPENSSLKGKRQVVKSIIARIQNKFNLSAAEVGNLDLWQVATIGVAVVSNDQRYSDEVLNKVVDFVGNSHVDADIIDYNIEIIPIS